MSEAIADNGLLSIGSDADDSPFSTVYLATQLDSLDLVHTELRLDRN